MSSPERVTAQAISQRLKCSDQCVREAIRAFDRAGLDSLQPKTRVRHDDRQALDVAGRKWLQAVIRRSPGEFGFEGSLWTLDWLAELAARGWYAPEELARVLWRLGDAVLCVGDYETTARLLHECVWLRCEQGFQEAMVRFMIGMAGMALMEDHPQQSAIFLGAAEEAGKHIDQYSSLAEPIESARIQHEVQISLDAGSFPAAREAGREASRDEVLQSALQEAAGAWGLIEA